MEKTKQEIKLEKLKARVLTSVQIDGAISKGLSKGHGKWYDTVIAIKTELDEAGFKIVAKPRPRKTEVDA